LVKLVSAVSNNICCDKLKELSDLNIFLESFHGPLKTLWRATFGSRAAICPTLAYVLEPCVGRVNPRGLQVQTFFQRGRKNFKGVPPGFGPDQMSGNVLVANGKNR